MSIPYTSLLTAFIALAAVIGLVFLAGRVARTTGLVRAQNGKRLAVRETIAIDRTRSIRIVVCDGRELLLLVGGGSDVLLGWLSDQELPR